MSYILKSIFNFSQTKDTDSQISQKFIKLQTLTRQLQKDKLHDIPPKIKQILNQTLFLQKGQSLFEMVYRNASKQSPIQWVPALSKAVNIFSPNSSFMKVVIQAQDYKIPIEKYYIPNYLFKNNLLNQNSAYQGISNSVSGLMVPLIDYVFIRLLHAIHNVSFRQVLKQPNQEYKSDDFYFYLSRNPYLMLLRVYLDYFSGYQKLFKKLVADIKMFFVDQILLKHRINKSTSYLKDYSFYSNKCKIKPHYLLVVYLLLKKGRLYFEQKNLFFYEVIQRFYSLIQTQHQIFFRFLFRIFLFAYSKNSIENSVIDHLQNANQTTGIFQLQRYSTQQFSNRLDCVDKRQLVDYNQSKTPLLKLFQKDQNLLNGNRIHFSTLRTLGCFLRFEQLTKKSNLMKQSSDSLRWRSQAQSLQFGIQKLQNGCKLLIKRQVLKNKNNFIKQSKEKVQNQIKNIKQLYFQVYNRRINQRFQKQQETIAARDQKTRGNDADFTTSVQTYKKDIYLNPWKIPLKQSEYQILYDLFKTIARYIDMIIPGQKQDQPRINIRFLCNPFWFMIVMILLAILLKIIF